MNYYDNGDKIKVYSILKNFIKVSKERKSNENINTVKVKVQSPNKTINYGKECVIVRYKDTDANKNNGAMRIMAETEFV